jgi:hypothetical protein
MLERYGWDKYLIDTQAEEIASDDFGILYRKDIPNDEPLVMIRVTNSTPESDGSRKDYFLRIDPDAYGGAAGRLPQAALASTVRIQQVDGSWKLLLDHYEDYRPALES